MVAAAVQIPQTAYALYCFTYPKDANIVNLAGVTSDECKNLPDAQINKDKRIMTFILGSRRVDGVVMIADKKTTVDGGRGYEYRE